MNVYANILGISDENDFIAEEYTKFVYIYTEEGNVKSKFEVPKEDKVWDVAFNHVTEEIIVLTRDVV